MGKSRSSEAQLIGILTAQEAGERTADVCGGHGVREATVYKWATHGRRVRIISDNGTEFTSNAVLGWRRDQDVDRCYLRPGKPVETAYAESFIGRLRDGFRNKTLFLSLAQAREEVATWCDGDTHVRPHGALGWRTPAEVLAQACPVDRMDKPDVLPTNPQGHPPQVLFSTGLIGGPTPDPTVTHHLEGLS